MKRVIDIHHHLNTLPNFIQLRSRIQNHVIDLEDHIKKDLQTIISVSVYSQIWQSYSHLIEMITKLVKQVDSHGPEVQLIKEASDLDKNYHLGLILHIESARLLNKPQSQLPKLFDLGVRGIIPVHFIDNSYGNSCDDPLRKIGVKTHDLGLTNKGKEFIQLLNHLNMWVDLSHTSDQSADDILELAESVMVSHTGIRDLIPSKRNKSILFLKNLANQGGIFGLTPWQHLIGKNKNSYIDVLEFALQSGLEKAVCIGTDFGAPIKTHKTIKSLYDCFETINILKPNNENIQWKNAYNFLKKSLPQ